MKYYILSFFLFAMFCTRVPAQTGTPPDNIYTETGCSSMPDSSIWEWGIQLDHTSTRTAAFFAKIIAGDIDNDGRVEVIAQGFNRGTYTIYDDQLNEKHTFSGLSRNNSTDVGYAIAIADVDHDGLAEIFICNDTRMACYVYDGTYVMIRWEIDITPGSYTALSIADINADGIPEIVVRDQIFNAQTGELEVTLPYTGIGRGTVTIPALADMDNDGILEVVANGIVVKVEINNPHSAAGNSAYVWKSIGGDGSGGHTYVADIDLDGFLEAIVIRASGLLVWKPYTGPASSPSTLIQISYGGPYSVVCIADLNQDGYPEISWIHHDRIFAYKYYPGSQSLGLMWETTIDDQSSEMTGVTAFDFNQDGYPELIHRDEHFLRIFNGTNGDVLASIPCRSGTSDEYPIVIDLDRDGSAEILVSEDIGPGSVIRSYKAPDGVRWAPARSVWNQYCYHVININEDLTVPQYRFNPTSTFTDPDDSSVVRRPFNNFLQQATYINQHGIPFIPMADAAFIQNSIDTINLCDPVQLELTLHNLGSKTLDAGYSITVYKDQYPGEIIQNYVITTPLHPDSTYDFILSLPPEELIHFLPIHNLVVTLNDAGTGIAQHGGQQEECDTLNNTVIIPLSGNSLPPVVQTGDTLICKGSSITPVFQNVISWNWSDGSEEPEIFPEDEGIYTLIASNECGADTVDINVRFFKELEVNLGNDTILCSLLPLLLDATHPNALSYLWQDHSTNATYTVYYDGQYWVIVTDHCKNKSDTINVGFLINMPVELGNDTTICEGSILRLNVSTPHSQYLWQDGSTTPTYLIRHTGRYSVTVSNVCFSKSDTIYVETEDCSIHIYFPSSFTPNGDGLNDLFLPQFNKPEQITAYRISIYDRWGSLLFNSHDLYQGWDGKYKGSLCPIGVYSCIIEYTNETGKNFTTTGSITLMR